MTRKYLLFALVLTGLAVVATAAIYPQLPERIPTHWNIRGEIDDYGDRAWAAFLVPAIMLGLTGLFAAIPWLSPKQFTVDTFRSTYGFICATVLVTMAYIHVLLMWAALAGPVDNTRPLLGGLMVMFATIGNVLGKVRRNFWVGVRTPWTIASERVWNDTHRLAGKTFVGSAVIGLVVTLLPLPLPAVAITTVVVIFAGAFSPVVYSLLIYKRLERSGQLTLDPPLEGGAKS